MPIIETNSGYGYVYRTAEKKKHKMPSFFKFILIIILLIIVVFGAFIVSSSVQGFIGINKNCVFSKTTLYAIKINELDDYSSAKVLSESLLSQDGAGYIVSKNNNYSVLISCYEKIEDANKIVSNLQRENITATIENITLNEYNINLELIDSQRLALSSAVNSFFNSYKNLYNLAINYDNKTLSKVEVIEEIDRLIETTTNTKNTFNKECVTSVNANFVYLKIYLINLISTLEKLKSEEQNFSGKIKYYYFECINLYCNFCQEIQ